MNNPTEPVDAQPTARVRNRPSDPGYDIQAAAARSQLANAHRLVVKVGSSSLTNAAGTSLDNDMIARLAHIVAARSTRTQVGLVSSGAIAAGLAPLGLTTRPHDLATQQAAASVGQGALLAAYSAAFAEHHKVVGQVLLTADDTTRRTHYLNAQRTLARLLDLGIIPIINENDTVVTDEIRFGDNDRLAALAAHLIGADALVLLTDVDALYTDRPEVPGARRVACVRGPQDLAEVRIEGRGSQVGTGGMATKVEAASIAAAAGITTVLADAADLAGALGGADVGTVFLPRRTRRASRTWWLRHATSARGRLVVDEGAVVALRTGGKSLLPAGITAVEGSFSESDPVDVVSATGQWVARGLTNYSSAELPRMLGRTTHQLAQELGPAYQREVIHRDHLAL